mgnify:CR=1 FL=1
MESTTKPLTILHFNDVYNINERDKEPVGGIARFKTALDLFAGSDPLIAFSGDLFGPCPLTPITQGEHMIKPLNSFGVHISCLGNHDFDIELHDLEKWIQKCNFPWILSNVKDIETQLPLGGAKEYHILTKQEYKIGFIGLAE